MLGLHCCAGLSLAVASGGLLSRYSWVVFSLQWLLLFDSPVSGTGASVVVAHGVCRYRWWALEQMLSGCDAWTSLLLGTWDLPGQGIEPVSPALAGGFLATRPPGKLLTGLTL